MSANDQIARTSVNQSPGGGTDYPFQTQSGASGIVLDCYLSYDDQACGHRLPFTLTLAGDDVTVTDADAVTVLHVSKPDAVLRAWGDREIREWTGDADVLRLVTNAYADCSGVLDTRTCDRLPARVRSFRVGLVKVTGNVQFRAGYNISMAGADADAPADGGRYRTTVSMDAVPGAGTGRLNGCEELTPVIRKINQEGPDCGGNFKIEVDPCMRVSLPLRVTGDMGDVRTAEFAAAGLTAEEARHALRFTSDCHPCCECDYFVRTYRGLKRMWNRWRDIASKAETARDVYEENRTRWMDSKDCRSSTPARLVVTSDFTCKTFVGGSFCNFTTCCLSPVELRFTFRRYKNGTLADWTSGSANEAYISGSPVSGDELYAPQLAGGGQVAQFFLDYANPQDTSVAKMKFCTNGCASTDSLEVALTVHIPDSAGNAQTGDPCDMATPSVPSWVTDVWAAAGVTATPTVRAVLTKTAALNPDPPRFNCGC